MQGPCILYKQIHLLQRRLHASIYRKGLFLSHLHYLYMYEDTFSCICSRGFFKTFWKIREYLAVFNTTLFSNLMEFLQKGKFHNWKQLKTLCQKWEMRIISSFSFGYNDFKSKASKCVYLWETVNTVLTIFNVSDSANW